MARGMTKCRWKVGPASFAWERGPHPYPLPTSFAGVVAVCLSQPMDTITTRMNQSVNHMNVIEASRLLYSAGPDHTHSMPK